jgi:hypothetical protein
MKENTRSKFSRGLRRVALAVVAIGIAAAPALHAKSNADNMAAKPVNVVAHVDLSGGSVNQMMLVKKNHTEYLVVGLGSSSGVALFDVSKPAQPRAINTSAGIAGASVTELKVVADTLAVFGTSGAEVGASSEPKEVQGVPGVTSFLNDKAHGLIYVTNGDGLWIVKTKHRADADQTYVDPDQLYMGGG